MAEDYDLGPFIKPCFEIPPANKSEPKFECASFLYSYYIYI